jgi:uncharacterized protein
MLDPIAIAASQGHHLGLLPALANRHGLITGATGTGKTVSLQTLAEGFSRLGVPVFMADVKGDLSGLAAAGQASEKLSQVCAKRQLPLPDFAASPCVFWDLWGEQGHPVRATLSDMGPVMLAQLFNLNDVQTGVLQLVFKIADDQDLLIIDTKDLRALLQHVTDNAKTYSRSHGNISAASIAAISRALLNLEQEGGEQFFGEPMLNIMDLLQTDAQGRGLIHILAADQLILRPRVYAGFLLWLLAELFEQLPEVGDLDKPKLVFFFDEAHLLFSDAPAALLQKIEQVVRLIRSKGVGIYFVTQNPIDIPDTVLGQLGNRIQHALRAFSPKDQKAVKAAAQSLRPNPAFSAEAVISELAVGEALVSLMDSEGRPNPVERAYILPPASRLGPLSAAERQAQRQNCLLAGIYDRSEDSHSAYEQLQAQAPAETAPAARPGNAQQDHDSASDTGSDSRCDNGGGSALQDLVFGTTGPRGGRKPGVVEEAAKSLARTLASEVGRQLVRGILGSLTGSKGRRR